MERKKFELLMGENGSEENILDYDFNRIAGGVLKKKRKEKHISLETLSDRMNNLVSKQALSRYENGQARIKNIIFVYFCRAVGSKPIDVFTEINKEYMAFLEKHMEEIAKRIEDKK